LKMDPVSLLKLGIIDKVVKEPVGGAHRDPELTYKNLKSALKTAVKGLKTLSVKDLLEERYRKFRSMGVFSEKKK